MVRRALNASKNIIQHLKEEKNPLSRLLSPGYPNGIFLSVLNDLVNFALLGNAEI